MSLVLSVIFISTGTQDHGDRETVRLSAGRTCSVILNTSDRRVYYGNTDLILGDS